MFSALTFIQFSTFAERNKLTFVTPREAIDHVKTGDRIWLHGMGCNPSTLTKALLEKCVEDPANAPRNLLFESSHLDGPVPHLDPRMAEFSHTCHLFSASSGRKPIAEGRATYAPVSLSDYPRHMERYPPDVVLMTLAAPDRHGNCSMGVDCTGSWAAAQQAKKIIAQINPQMPRTFGVNQIHVSKLTAAIQVNHPIYEVKPAPPNEEQMKIASNIVPLVSDGAVLQCGIGGVPDAVLNLLKNHKHLGIHTEMLTSTFVDLLECGAIDNSTKKIHNGVTVCTFVDGKKALYDYVNDNPMVQLYPADYVNNPFVISQNENHISINAGLAIDLTGQVCADSIGTRFYSGVGGQADFMMGGNLSKGGKQITCIPSTANGKTRIVPTLLPGSGVVTPRHLSGWVVTEFGAVYIWGRSFVDRAKLLISVSHPNYREKLCEDATKMFNQFVSPNDPLINKN